jgi:uncharacterized protein GlcG (DUF336 family)
MKALKLDVALSLMTASLNFARSHNLPPLSVVVLDEGGQVKASASEDNVGIARNDIALGKAHAALGMGFGTRQFFNLVQQKVLPEMFASTINGATAGKFIPLPGGVLINDENGVIGALGISGASSNQDEEIACLAIQSLGLVANP